MKPNKLIGLVAVGLIFPSTAIAFSNSVLAEVRVKTANVEAVTRSDGSIYINTGNTSVSVPSRHTRQSWNPFRYWNSWRSYSSPKGLASEDGSNRHCRQTTYQSTRQTTQSRSHIVQHSSYSNCK